MKQFSTTPNIRAPKPTREQIEIAAFHLFIENCCQHGHDLDHWLRAEELLTQKLEEELRARMLESDRKDASPAPEFRAGGKREHPVARDERGTATREEIRRKIISRRPVARQPQWRAAHAAP